MESSSLQSEVLEAIKASNANHVEAFPACLQYKASRDADDGAEDPEDPVKKKKKKQKGKKKAPKKKRVHIQEVKAATADEANQGNKTPGQKREHTFGDYKPETYKKARLKYIEDRRSSTGCSFQEASDAWGGSDDKKNLLCKMPVGELIRRRFIPKGSTENPWAA